MAVSAQEFKPSANIKPKVESVKPKEPQEIYFEEIAGSSDSAKPFLKLHSEMQDKENSSKKHDLLKQLVELVSNCEFSDEVMEKNIIARLTSHSAPVMKSLKDAVPSNNDFKKGGNQQKKNNQGGFNKGGDRKERYGNRQYNRDERPAENQEWRAEEDEMV